MRQIRSKKNVILGIAILACVGITAGIGLHLHRAYVKQVAVWNEVACEAFRDALLMEVKKRGDIEVLAFEHYLENAKTLVTPVPDFVTLEIEGYGKKEFRIPRKKYEHSLIKELNNISLFGFLLEAYPLSLDTLNRNWDSLLLARKVEAQTYVRYTHTDFEERDSVAYSRLPDKKLRADSLVSYYMGIYVEHEATGFIAYSAKPVSAGWWYGLLLLWGCLFGAVCYYERLSLLLRKKFVKYEVTVQEKVVEKEVLVEKLVEKKVYMPDFSPSVECYDLGGGVIFDVAAQSLRKGGEVRKLRPQVHNLLQHFLRAPHHRMTAEEIYQAMWNGGGNPEMIYSMIYRFRKALEGMSSLSIHYDGNGTYSLQMPEKGVENDMTPS